MKNFAIARRYAKALLLIGKEDGKADTYRQELSGIAGLIEGDSALKQAITNPLYNAAGRRQVLEAVVGKLNLSKVMTSFLLLLFDKGRIGFLTTISDFFEKMVDELQGLARASLVSAGELPGETVEKIRVALSKRIGKEVTLEVEQDPSLIGGIVTRIGDLVLDGSIKTQLISMRESLKRGESV
ncbi:ATP synthase delta chain (EC [Olavius algarvensis associated proteobacterium Delta 3]|nr:ATP synthase delta chain (EC [Olavius algarvensis associated proteobacterium Delta 3]CAB5158094.1 ATP synthase delta chain (EC [Olavius algarvensis associated proteobacterium Delta 3]